jgi:2-dehydropantoate 2-reductase
MKIAVMGAGGVGGYFGALLHRAGERVWFVARGDHLKAIQAHGLRVTSVLGDVTLRVSATDNPADVGIADLVLFCVKSYDTDAAAAQMRPMIGPGTTILCLQNGVDNEERLAAVYGGRAVLPGVVYIFSVVSAPGVVCQSGGPRRISFGERDGSSTPRVSEIYATLSRAGIDCERSDRITGALWEKFILICALGGMTALTRLSIGEIRSCDETWAMYGAVVAEVAAVARARRVPIGAAAPEQTMALSAGMAPDSRSSLYHDLVTGRRLEVDALAGTVVRLGDAAGVPTPMNRAIYAALKPYDLRARGDFVVR